MESQSRKRKDIEEEPDSATDVDLPTMDIQIPEWVSSLPREQMDLVLQGCRTVQQKFDESRRVSCQPLQWYSSGKEDINDMNSCEQACLMELQDGVDNKQLPHPGSFQDTIDKENAYRPCGLDDDISHPMSFPLKSQHGHGTIITSGRSGDQDICMETTQDQTDVCRADSMRGALDYQGYPPKPKKCIHKRAPDEYRVRMLVSSMQLVLQVHQADCLKYNSSVEEVMQQLQFGHCTCTGDCTVFDPVTETFVGWRIWRLEMLDLHERRFKFLNQLVNHTPYIKATDGYKDVFQRLKHRDELPDLPIVETKYCIMFFTKEVHMAEPKFHPLIRKGVNNELMFILDCKAKAERLKFTELLEPTGMEVGGAYHKFVDALFDVLKSMCKPYKEIAEKVALHKEFNSHIAQCTSVKPGLEVEVLLEDKDVVIPKFAKLDKDLIIESLEGRLNLLERLHQIDNFLDCLNSLVHQKVEQGKTDIDPIVDGHLEGEDLSNYSNFSDEIWYKLIQDITMTGAFHGLRDDYVVYGIMCYLEVCMLLGEGDTPSRNLTDYMARITKIFRQRRARLNRVWLDGRNYDHSIYRHFKEPIQMLVWDKDADDYVDDIVKRTGSCDCAAGISGTV